MAGGMFSVVVRRAAHVVVVEMTDALLQLGDATPRVHADAVAPVDRPVRVARGRSCAGEAAGSIGAGLAD